MTMGGALRLLTARLTWSIHSNLDGSVVGGHLGRVGEHSDGQSEALTCKHRRVKAL